MDFENANVLQQLRCGGVLEAVRISCAGFPTKFPFEDFVDHFWNLVPELLVRDDLDDAALAKAICQKARLQGFQVGKTKVGPPPARGHTPPPSKSRLVALHGYAS
jgi:myosin-5